MRRKDLEMEVERLNGELQQVWEILRSRVMLHYAEDLRTQESRAPLLSNTALWRD